MKKYLSISILLLSVIIFSCSDNVDELNANETSMNEVIFEDITLLKNISPNFYDNHFYRVEQLGDNKEKKKIISLIIDKGFNQVNLISEDVKKFYFNNTNLLMYSISIKDSQNKLIIYKYEGLYQVNFAEYYSVGNKMQFEMKTFDNKLYYSLQINGDNKIGNFNIKDNIEISNFSSDVYSLSSTFKNFSTNECHPVEQKGKCCRKQCSWSDCMDCSVSACGQTWYCAITFALLPVEFSAGLAASCIGAGPNSWC